MEGITKPRVYRCQGIMPSGMKCGRYAEYLDNDLWLCHTCHLKVNRANWAMLKAKAETEGIPVL